MNEVISVPVPLALRHLIESNNQLLQDYQKQLTTKVLQANEELMQILQLNPDEGWRLDIGTFTYVNTTTTDAPPVSE